MKYLSANKYFFIKSLFFLCISISNLLLAEEYSPEVRAQVIDIQKQMRTDLREGSIERARNSLERASGNFHAVEIELGIIQTLMQAGEYRHALSAAAHTQAEHPDIIDSTLLYAWLLAIGGQTSPALQLMDTTLKNYPDSASLNLMQRQIKTRQFNSAELITSGAIQLKPFTSAISSNKTEHNLASGIVINNSNRVITNLALVEKVKTLRVRNGLGQEIGAHIEQKILEANLAILTLDKSFSNSSAINIADKTPFPGTPIYILGFSSLNQTESDWPQLQVDILGTPTADGSVVYPIHLQQVARGSGVFNPQGDLIGIVDGTKNKVMLPLANLMTTGKAHPGSNRLLTRIPVDEIYEISLRNCVQVLGK